MKKRLVSEQFGAHAAEYITSTIHAKGASLARLLSLVKPEAHWCVLDIATATGHTAFTFAPHVEHVWATDITQEMLSIAQQQVQERGLANVTVEYADAEELPYEGGRFDLVTCRIAPHHFGDIARFLVEASRVLRSAGLLAIVDNIVPPGPAGDYINAFERFRDPSHGRCLSAEEWRMALAVAGFVLAHEENLDKQVILEAWAARHDDTTRAYLRAMLTEVSGEAADFLRPAVTDGSTAFHLKEGLFIGRKA